MTVIDTWLKKSVLALMATTLLGCEDMSRDLKVKNIQGYDFSLRDIQEGCTVKREGDQAITIMCKSPNLRSVERSCVGQMSAGLSDPKFYCSGGLWVLNESCYIQMTTQQVGNVLCKK